MANYPRGSEWRRWDLHIHTPGTIKSDEFCGSSLDEKWDNFYSDIDAYIGNIDDPLKGIAAIGITDYLSIENYLKVKTDCRLPPSIELILPNIEMRIAIPAEESPVNIHFIFDPAFDSSIESRFLSKLKFSYPNHGEFSATKSELIRLGKAVDPALNDTAAYKKGNELFIPSFDSIQKLFEANTDMRDRTIVVVSNSSTDGVCGIGNGNGQMQGVKRNILHFADGVFSGNPSDRDFYLGKKPGCPVETVLAEGGGLKPCFHGSDAHTNSRLFEPAQKRYCWIKADPTFNGLKQVLYEPEERVCISETIPDYKPDYQVIDSVTFENLNFSTEPIFLNDKLVCIIGGKSTGKSIWLYNTARIIDPEQVRNKTTAMKPPLHASLRVDQLQVHWRGAENEASANRKIVYIPQTYLNRLSGDQGGEKTEIDNMIQDVVLQSASLLTSYKKVEYLITGHKAITDKAIYDLVKIQSNILEAVTQQAELGEKTGIKAEINKLTAQKDLLAKEASISDEDLRAYDEAVRQIDSLDKRIQAMDDEIRSIDAIPSLIRESEISFLYSDTTLILLKQAIQNAVKKANEVWAKEKELILQAIRAEKQSCVDSKISNERKRDGLRGKVESNKAISQLTIQIRSEERKLTQFEELEVKQEKFETQHAAIKSQLLEDIQCFRKIRQDFADDVNRASDDQAEDDLDFKVLVPFRGNAFLQAVQSVAHNSNLRASLRVFSEEKINEQDFQTYLPELLDKILTGEIKLKNSNTPETALRTILTDWYNITYSVKMDGDEINTMSPGKKALVLLKLLIGMAETKCPILIDQPEDDLDNRSIFKELIPYILKKKKERQIIIVTHNANVVLGADADQVIVANQRGKDTPNKMYKFEYLSGSIENDCAEDQHSQFVLYQKGIQQHICDILEGGEDAFKLRKNKYRLG